ncbi:hypothetical protein NDU88_003961 [Pleurodeles waltl]|uniref:Uncharacterized protein n=1 Tax=Pleurodeles waltl TaxID=8319 RepID=A0AAV7M8H7_PLEWA|nr:hypothetical protein NDU88_003961 [Pleurodeles waltl]
MFVPALGLSGGRNEATSGSCSVVLRLPGGWDRSDDPEHKARRWALIEVIAGEVTVAKAGVVGDEGVGRVRVGGVQNVEVGVKEAAAGKEGVRSELQLFELAGFMLKELELEEFEWNVEELMSEFEKSELEELEVLELEEMHS